MRLQDLPDGYPITVDTETSGLYPDDGARLAAVSFAFRVPDEDGQSDPSQPMIHKAIPFDQGIVGLPLGPKVLDERTTKRISRWPDWAYNEDASNLSPERFQALVQQLMRLRLIFHNAKFDMHIFDAGLRGIEPITRVDLQDVCLWDTQITQRVLDPQEPVSLKPTSVRLHLGISLGVKEGMEDAEAEALKPWLGPKTGKNADPRYDLVPWSIMGPYAGMDAALTLLLWEYQWERLYKEDEYQKPHIRQEHELMRTLYQMEQLGLPYDIDTGNAMAELVEAERRRVASQLPFDPTPARARLYFFGDPIQGGLGHPLYADKLTEKRKDPQVDDEVISRLAAEEWEGQEVAKVYQRHEALKSANSKWYRSWTDMVGDDGRIRTNHRQCQVVSGRLSVERFQAQAIPQPYQMPKVEGLVGVRQLFKETAQCPCGCGTYQMWEFDVSQAEIRIATAMAECRPMLDGFLRGDDSHSIACRLMFGDTYAADGFTGREEEHEKWSEYRQVAKRCNLGILYGAGRDTIQREIKKFTGIEYPKARVGEWIDVWNAAFPQMGARLQEMEFIALRRGWVKLINGRQRWFSPYEQLHKAFNQEIQGSLAEVMKMVMIRVRKKYPNSLMLQIHDSVVCRVAPHEIDAMVPDIRRILIQTYEQAFTRRWKSEGGMLVKVPFESDVKRFGYAG